MLEAGIDLLGENGRTERPIHIAELRTMVPGREADAAAHGLRSALVFPMMDGAVTNGAIEFYSCRQINVDDSLLEALSTLGHQIGQTIERRRVAEALLESQQLTAAILASATRLCHHHRRSRPHPCLQRDCGTHVRSAQLRRTGE